VKSRLIPVITALALLCTLPSCAKRKHNPLPLSRDVERAAPAPGAPGEGPHLDAASRAFLEGLAAFHEFTPEGYARAIPLFRRASELDAANCTYQLHAAQASLFLAYEQELNFEDFPAALSEGATPACAAADSPLHSASKHSARFTTSGRPQTATSDFNLSRRL